MKQHQHKLLWLGILLIGSLFVTHTTPAMAAALSPSATVGAGTFAWISPSQITFTSSDGSIKATGTDSNINDSNRSFEFTLDSAFGSTTSPLQSPSILKTLTNCATLTLSAPDAGTFKGTMPGTALGCDKTGLVNVKVTNLTQARQSTVGGGTNDNSTWVTTYVQTGSVTDTAKAQCGDPDFTGPCGTTPTPFTTLCTSVSGYTASDCTKAFTACLAQNNNDHGYCYSLPTISSNPGLLEKYAGGPPPDPTATAVTCETSFSNPVTWFLCPVYNGVADFSDWLLTHAIQPMLKTPSIPTTATTTDASGNIVHNAIYPIWSGFRLIANILLIVAVLVIVFGQTIGGGLVDAYTARRALPRILAAAILINLSIYIVAGLVDITNVVGGGIASLMTLPLSQSGDLKFHMSLAQSAGTIIGTGVTMGGSVIGAVVAASAGTAILADAGIWIALFVVLPAFLALLLAFVTIMLRQAAIYALIIISPVAFALWTLPNTEKYFKKWWEFLFTMLIAYPIIMAIFAICDILAVTVTWGTGNPAAPLFSIILQFLPLFLIPFAFRLAGGALGQMSGMLMGLGKRGTEAVKGNANDSTSLRNVSRRNMVNGINQARGSVEASRRGSKNRAVRAFGKYVGGGARIQERLANQNAEEARRVQVPWDSGADNFVKASTIPLSVLNKRRLSKDRYRAADADDNKSGVEQWAAADGTWFSESVIRQGNRDYQSASARQVNYRNLLGKTEPMGTAAQNAVFEDYLEYASDALDDNTAAGTWQGISIPLKGARLDLRRAEFKRDKTTGRFVQTGKFDDKGMLTEAGNMQQHDLVRQTASGHEAIGGSIARYAAGGNESTPEGRQKLELARNAYLNFERFVTGRAAPQGAQEVMAGGEAPEGGGAPAFATEQSAAYKNAEAAKRVYAQLRADPNVGGRWSTKP